jgi:formate dehydrogenase assembly factor FdhD
LVVADVIGPLAREDQIADAVTQQFQAEPEPPALAGTENLHKAAHADDENPFLIANENVSQHNGVPPKTKTEVRRQKTE